MSCLHILKSSFAAFMLSFLAFAPAMAADGEEHAGGASLPQFDPTWFASQLFWLSLSFVILYVLFSKKVLPDLSSVLENRKDHIQSDLETAEQLKAEAEKAQHAYESGLEHARQEAARLVGDTQNELKLAAEQASAAFRSRAEDEANALEARITAAKSDAMADMSSIAAEVASEAARKIVGIDADINKAKNVVKALHEREAA